MSQSKSIDELLKQFSDRYSPIPQKDRPYYYDFMSLIQENGKISAKRTLDYVFLWSYVMGHRTIVDSDTGEKRRIKSLDDLFLLSMVNVRSKDKDDNRNNPELYRLWGRMNERHRCHGIENWRKALSFLFSHKEVAAYFGERPSYDKHVIAFEQKKEKYNQEMLRQLKDYVLGRLQIMDQKTGQPKRIRGIKDLRLLSRKNVSGLDSGYDIYNTELRKILGHLENDERKHGISGWGATLDILFSEPEVVKYFGGQTASYKSHVVVMHTSYAVSAEVDRNLLKEYILGELPIVDRHTGNQRYIKKLDDLVLLSSANVKAKTKKRFVNSELKKLFVRINGRHHDHNTPNWGGMLMGLFRTHDVLNYFGKRPDYGLHVLEFANKYRKSA